MTKLFAVVKKLTTKGRPVPILKLRGLRVTDVAMETGAKAPTVAVLKSLGAFGAGPGGSKVAGMLLTKFKAGKAIEVADPRSVPVKVGEPKGTKPRLAFSWAAWAAPAKEAKAMEPVAIAKAPFVKFLEIVIIVKSR